MNITLYKIKRDSAYINKDVLNCPFFMLTGNIREPTSILNPIIDIQRDNTRNFTEFNYLYIEEFNRWYYITDMEIHPSNIITYYCHVDVLYTYWDTISQTYAQVDLYENSDNDLLPNENIMVESTEILTDVTTIGTHIFTENDGLQPLSFVLSGIGLGRGDIT